MILTYHEYFINDYDFSSFFHFPEQIGLQLCCLAHWQFLKSGENKAKAIIFMQVLWKVPWL